MVNLGMSLLGFMFCLENTYLELKPLQNYPKVIVIVIKAQVHFLEIQTILILRVHLSNLPLLNT